MQAADDRKPRAKCRSALQGESGRRRKSRIRGAASSQMGIHDNPPEMGSVPVSIPCSPLHTGQSSAPGFFCPNRHLPRRFWLPITDVTRLGGNAPLHAYREFRPIQIPSLFWPNSPCRGAIDRCCNPNALFDTGKVLCTIHARLCDPGRPFAASPEVIRPMPISCALTMIAVTCATPVPPKPPRPGPGFRSLPL